MVELRYTQSIKKYTDESRPEVVDYVRAWVTERELMAVHEDKSLIKVTGSKTQIEGLLAELAEKFDWHPATDPRKKK